MRPATRRARKKEAILFPEAALGPSMDTLSVYVTAPDEATARRLAGAMVEARLAACANLWPIASIYRWEGRIEEGREFALLLKTRRALLPALERALQEAHPYDVPCVVAWPIAGGAAPYLAYVADATKP